MPAGREVNHSLAAGRLQVFRNLPSRREKRDWFRGARRLIRDRAKGLGPVQPRERQFRRPEHLESIDRTRWIGGIHRRRQDRMRVHVRMRSQKERRIKPHVQVLRTEAGRADRDQFLVAALFRRRRQSAGGCQRLKPDPENARQGSRLFGGGDPGRVHRQDLRRTPLGQARGGRQLSQGSGLARARTPERRLHPEPAANPGG